jgi:hypothetical protein
LGLDLNGNPSDKVTTRVSDGGCVIDFQAVGIAIVDATPMIERLNLIEVVDFVPSSSGAYYLNLTARCARACLDLSIQPGAATYKFEEKPVGGSLATLATGDSLLLLDQSNRLVFWVNGDHMEAWLNGRLLGSATIQKVHSPGPQGLSVDSVTTQPASIKLLRIVYLIPNQPALSSNSPASPT